MKTELESILSQPVCGGSTAKRAHRTKAAVVDLQYFRCDPHRPIKTPGAPWDAEGP